MRKLLFILLLFISTTMFADNYISITTGLWENTTTWDINDIPMGTKEDVITVSAYDTVTAINLDFSKATIINIKPYGVLIVNTLDVDIDAAEVKKEFQLNIENNGKMIVNGDFTLAKDAVLTVDGFMKVTGDLTAGKGSVILGTGSVSVDGIVDGPDGFINDPQLPIELLYFNTNTTSIYNILNWATASEENNDYFIIEKSYNFLEWYEITSVPGAGNSQTTLYYSYEDTADNFLTYYRLTQIDYDGKFETFNIISVFNSQVNTEGYHNMIVYNTNGLIVAELSDISELQNLERNKLYIIKFINKYTSRSMKYILR